LILKQNINKHKEVNNMSQHPSLRVGGKIRKIRNVMKRYERLNVLRAEGRIPEDKVMGLPKTKPVEV
jgi:small basic protein (TIGR04137 family)